MQILVTVGVDRYEEMKIEGKDRVCYQVMTMEEVEIVLDQSLRERLLLSVNR